MEDRGFKHINPFDVTEAEVDAFLVRKGIPTLVKPTPSTHAVVDSPVGETAAANPTAADATVADNAAANITAIEPTLPQRPQRAVLMRWAVNIPVYLYEELRAYSEQEGVSMQALTMAAFRKIGFTVHDDDFGVRAFKRTFTS